MGPGGRTVAIDPFERHNSGGLSVDPQPIVTKDGVTVAKYMNFIGTDMLKNVGAKLLIDAAERTNEESGDGTTTCTVIARALIEQGCMVFMLKNVDHVAFRQGIQQAVGQVCA